MTTAIGAGTVRIPDDWGDDDRRWLEIDDGIIRNIHEGAAPPGAQDLGDVILTAGFVDLQINGIGPVDFWTTDAPGWRAAGQRLLASGVTSYLPTLVTAPLDQYDDALRRVASARDDAQASGLPRIEGVHLEGPFLGGAPGAHPRELIRSIDVEWLLGLLDAHPGLIRLVTLAPEADPDSSGIRALAAHGVVVALGHSRCTYDEAVAASHAGARLVTHVFNGMGPLNHHDPGLAGAALDKRVDLVPTLIVDFVHVEAPVVELVKNALWGDYGPILITDAVATDVDSFGQRVEARDGAAYLEDGTLTGSTLTMDAAVRNYARHVEWSTAIDHATYCPARVLDLPNLSDDFGSVRTRADLVALDRETLEVRHVWIAGEHVYGS